MAFTKAHIQLFQSLFKGREDIYAKRWEKEQKSGYMPAYDVDWDDYEKHKALGGTFKSYKHKKLAPFTEAVIRKHLAGIQTIGLYPLLKNNNSWLLAVDFDNKNWLNECRSFLKVCQENKVPAYLERSRSGEGGHVWIFFEEMYPAWKSRKIAFHLLRIADVLSNFEKETSFDRLFPNQDYLSGKGFGNLIALPLNKKWMTNENTCFIDPDSAEAFDDQWGYLENVQKVSVEVLDELFHSVDSKSRLQKVSDSLKNKELKVVLDSQVWLSKYQLSPKLIHFIREQLNFVNSDYVLKKKLGRSTWQTEKYFRLIEEQENRIVVPRGFLPDLIAFCRNEDIAFEIDDRRQKLEPTQFHSKVTLYSWQEDALEPTNNKDFGVLVAPPGSGKTIMGLELIARKQQPALIVVHRKQLFDEWVERIQSFLGIPEKDIGKYSGTDKKEGKRITVGMIQSLKTLKENDKLLHSFGTIIIDECHHIPAKTFRETITRFSSYYLYGLTATPMRKNNDEHLIYVYIGRILAEIPSEFLDQNTSSTVHINIQETSLKAPFNFGIDEYETLSKMLVYDTARNQLIVGDLKKVIDQKKVVLLLTERKGHIDVLNLYLKDNFETITLSGDDSKRSRESKMKQIQAGHFQMVLSTGQFFGEGIDVDQFDCLFLVYPFAFKGKLIQYLGRITRSEKLPVIYDYRDKHISYFEKLFKKRNQFYNEIRKANQMTMGFEQE